MSTNELFRSHSRPIGLQMLRDELKLEIDDYSEDADLRENVRSFHDLLTGERRTREAPYSMLGRTRG